MTKSRRLTMIAGGVVVLAAAGVGIIVVSGDRRPAPPAPVPVRFDEIDPAIVARIEDALADVTAAPGDPGPRITLGIVYAANELDDSARLAFEQAIGMGTDDARAWYHLAGVLEVLGDPEAALAAMEEAGRRSPSFAPARWRRGLMLLDRGDLDGAEAAFVEARDIDAASAAAWLGLARVHLRRSQHQQAAELLIAFGARSTSNQAYASHLLGLAYRGLGRASEAAEALQRGRGSGPEFADPWQAELEQHSAGYQAELAQARLRFEAGDPDGAVAILNEMRRRRAVTVDVFNNLGLAHLAAGRTTRAIEVLEQAVDVNANSYQAHHLLGGAYWNRSGEVAADEEDALMNRALAHARRALEISPASVPTLALMGDIRTERGELATAAQLYREAGRWAPDDPQWMMQAAMLYGRLQQWDSVAECLEHVVELTPDSGEAYGRLGLAYMHEGRLDDAAAALVEARRLAPGPQVDAALEQLEGLRRAAERGG